MLVLDTDHLGEFQRGSSASGKALRDRLRAEDDRPATTIVSAEEQMRGWLSLIHGEQDPRRQIRWYTRLQNLFQFYAEWDVLPWDDRAVTVFEELRSRRIRIGTMDLKIASIVLATDSVLLSRNLTDFSKVPGLHVEDWLS